MCLLPHPLPACPCVIDEEPTCNVLCFEQMQMFVNIFLMHVILYVVDLSKAIFSLGHFASFNGNITYIVMCV